MASWALWKCSKDSDVSAIGVLLQYACIVCADSLVAQELVKASAEENNQYFGSFTATGMSCCLHRHARVRCRSSRALMPLGFHAHQIAWKSYFWVARRSTSTEFGVNL